MKPIDADADCTRLDELTADEFYDVYRVFVPNATREEYERELEEFLRCKAEHQNRKGLQ